MQHALATARRFCTEEDGAAMVEYSILVGIVAAAAILAILAIGGWVTGRFSGLCGTLDGKAGGTCDAGAGTGT